MRFKAFSLPPRDKGWDIAHLGAMCLILLCNFVFVFSPVHENTFFHVFLNPLIIAMLAVAVYRWQGGVPWEMLPSFGFTLWYYCAYALRGNYYLLVPDSNTRCMAILLSWVMFFGTPYIFKAGLREKLASVFAHMLLLFFGLLAWIGLYGFFTGNQLQTPYTSTYLGIFNSPGISGHGRLRIFHLHANASAAMFMLALFCGIYLILRTRKKWLRAIYGLVMLGLYPVIALTDCRMVFVAIAGGAGLLLFLLCYRSPWASLGKRLCAGAAALAVTAALVFLSFSGVQSLLKPYGRMPSQEGASVRIPGIAVAVAEESEGKTVQTGTSVAQRNFFKDISSMGGRTKIFQALWQHIQEHPEILWKGSMPETAMDDVSSILGENDYYWRVNPMKSTHNSFLEALLITGIPGLLLALCFCAVLLVQSLRLFFARTGSLSARIWAILAWMLLLISMTEPYLFTPNAQNNIPDLLFFFAAGMAMAQAREELPPLFRRRKRPQAAA